jgi:3-hydroxybutyryl-CoA dehydrogenase
VLLTHRNFHAQIVDAVASDTGSRSQRDAPIILPMYRSRAVWAHAGARRPAGPSASAARTSETPSALSEHDVPAFTGVATTFADLLEADDSEKDDLSTLYRAGQAGDKLPVHEALEERLGVSVSEGDALTETTALSRAVRASTLGDEPGSVGHTDSKIIDPETGEKRPASDLPGVGHVHDDITGLDGDGEPVITGRPLALVEQRDSGGSTTIARSRPAVARAKVLVADRRCMASDSAAVVGGGVMGTGIAQLLARTGSEVAVREINEELAAQAREQLVSGNFGLDDAVEGGYMTEDEKEAVLDRLTFTTDLEAAVADTDFVLEAVTEDLAVKGTVFRQLDDATDDQPLYSNTSGFSVTSLANAVSDPSRVAVMHFFNPVPVMNLVEIVRAEETADEVVALAEDLVDELDKTGIVVDDAPGNYGFVANRIYAAMRREAQRVVDEGVATEAQVDTAMEEGYNLPVGPFSLAGIGEEW